jgi:hypothetical protein
MNGSKITIGSSKCGWLIEDVRVLDELACLFIPRFDAHPFPRYTINIKKKT